MNHRKGFNPLSMMTAHRRAMSRNMVTSLFRYERITTTKAKAKEVRKAAEKLITRSKVDSVHNRRQAAKYIQDKAILAKLFTEIGPRMADRQGGYTRVLKLGFRQGDSADMAILELVDYKLPSDDNASSKKSSAAKKTTAKKSVEKASEAASKESKTADKKTATKKASAKKSTTKKAAPKTAKVEPKKAEADK